eukprot:COSAG02_NODE_66087_length_256_cov_0.859873_1_plen_36_part_10
MISHDSVTLNRSPARRAADGADDATEGGGRGGWGRG